MCSSLLHGRDALPRGGVAFDSFSAHFSWMTFVPPLLAGEWSCCPDCSTFLGLSQEILSNSLSGVQVVNVVTNIFSLWCLLAVLELRHSGAVRLWGGVFGGFGISTMEHFTFLDLVIPQQSS